jgi:ATP-dependent exoDNAse (exonuclease V) beta subunit
MYEEDNTLIHGIIDLLLVFNDKAIIIDYKLKNVDDDAYLKQLNGYKKYIEGILHKNTDIYLYSILDGNLIKK